MPSDAWIDEAINNWSMSTVGDEEEEEEEEEETEERSSPFDRVCEALRDVGLRIPDAVSDHHTLCIAIEANTPGGSRRTTGDESDTTDTDPMVLSTLDAAPVSSQMRGVLAETRRLARKYSVR